MGCATVGVRAERGERTIGTPGKRLGFHFREQGVGPLQQGLEAVEALLPRGRQHAAQRGEVVRTLLGPKPARDLHAQLHHPQVLLGLIVGKGHRDIPQAAQHRLPAVPQPPRQVVPRAALLASPPSGLGELQGRQRLVIRQRLPDQLVIAPLEPLQQRTRQRNAPLPSYPQRPPQQLLQPPRPSFPSISASACNSRKWWALHIACSTPGTLKYDAQWSCTRMPCRPSSRLPRCALVR